jgi:RNA polymerase sigma-70 factor (ECF subfamily)
MTPELPEHYFRHEHGRLVSVLARKFAAQPVELCEDAAQAALLRALETWSHSGVPKEPGAWLYRVAHHLVIDALRAQKRHAPEAAEAAAEDPDVDAVPLQSELGDDLLRMLFLCADPEIPQVSQVALALKTLCGFTTDEIALRLFQSSDAIHKRLQRARALMREHVTDLDMPGTRELGERVPSIHQMLYLLFSEGYSSAKPDSVIRRELCEEAIRLALVLAAHPIGSVPETDALLALMYLHASRFDARVDGVGAILLLREQDRSRWDQSLIQEGVSYLRRSARGERVSRYHVEAAIAAEHCLAPTYEATPWSEIADLYSTLERVAPSPLHRLNRAIAVAEWKGPEAGIAVLEAGEAPPWLVEYYLWDATWSELYRRTGDRDRALTHLLRAIDSAPTLAEKALLEQRGLELQRDTAASTSRRSRCGR